MANGIPLAQRQRSALLQSLLQRQQQPVVTPIGAIGQLARAFAARQITKRQEEQEQQAAQQAQQQRNILAQQLVGRTAAERPPSGGKEALLSALVRSGTPQANTLLSQLGPSLLGVFGQQKRDIRKVGDQLVEIPQEGQPKTIFEAPQQPGFQGTGLRTQALNTLIGVRDGRIDPNSSEALAARSELSRPTTIATPQGTFVQEGMDVDAFLEGRAAPTGRGQAGFFPKELTEREKTAGFISGNILNEEKNLQRLFATSPNFNPGSLRNVISQVPLIGRALSSADLQIYKDGAEAWTAQKVFLQSGQTATDREVARDFRTLFPQPGEKPRSSISKELRRNQLMLGALQLGRIEKRIDPASAQRQINEVQLKIQELEQLLAPEVQQQQQPQDSSLTPEERAELENLERQFGGNR